MLDSVEIQVLVVILVLVEEEDLSVEKEIRFIAIEDHHLWSMNDLHKWQKKNVKSTIRHVEKIVDPIDWNEDHHNHHHHLCKKTQDLQKPLKKIQITFETDKIEEEEQEQD
jgi:hypothetical protein